MHLFSQVLFFLLTSARLHHHRMCGPRILTRLPPPANTQYHTELYTYFIYTIFVWYGMSAGVISLIVQPDLSQEYKSREAFAQRRKCIGMWPTQAIAAANRTHKHSAYSGSCCRATHTLNHWHWYERIAVKAAKSRDLEIFVSRFSISYSYIC